MKEMNKIKKMKKILNILIKSNIIECVLIIQKYFNYNTQNKIFYIKYLKSYYLIKLFTKQI